MHYEWWFTVLLKVVSLNKAQPVLIEYYHYEDYTVTDNLKYICDTGLPRLHLNWPVILTSLSPESNTDYECWSLKKGWLGMHIWQHAVPDPCHSQPCDPNADCDREGVRSVGFTCTCRPPFVVGNGFNCSSKSIANVDQSTTSVYICDIALWWGQYHDIALWSTDTL